MLLVSPRYQAHMPAYVDQESASLSPSLSVCCVDIAASSSLLNTALLSNSAVSSLTKV